MLFGKKKKEAGTAACACRCGCTTEEAAEIKTACCTEAEHGICCIEVLGMGCKSCHEQYEYAKEAAENMGLAVEVEYITDLEKVMAYGAMSMPAIVVNGQIVSMGKVLKPSEFEKLLHKLGF